MVALSDLSTRQRTYARVIFDVAVERFGADGPLAAVYGIACSGAEASLTNWENGGTSALVGKFEGRQINAAERAVARRSLGKGDGVPPWGDNLDSMGLFAQRPMSGWGSPEQIMQPAYAAGRFFDELAKVSGWRDRPAAEVIAKVQGFYNAAIYDVWLTAARQFVDSISAPSVAVPASKGDWFMANNWDEANREVDAKFADLRLYVVSQNVLEITAQAVLAHDIGNGDSLAKTLNNIQQQNSEIRASQKAIEAALTRLQK